MATCTVQAGGGNWSAAGTWDTQPTAADDVVLNASSGNLTLDTTGSCRSITCTGYTGTFNMSGQTLNVGDSSAGSITFVAGMTLTIDGTSEIHLASTYTTAAQTINSGGKTLPYIHLGAAGKWQLGANLACSRYNQDAASSTFIDAGYTVTVAGSITITNGTLTSTALWTQSATGNLSNASSTRPFHSLNAAPAGGTTTLTGDVYVGYNIAGGGALTLNSGKITGAYSLYNYPHTNNALSISASLDNTSQIANLYVGVQANVSQNGLISVPNSFVSGYIELRAIFGYNLTATADWNFGNNAVNVAGPGSSATPSTKYVDMASYSITCGVLSIGLAGSAYNGYLKFGTSTSHSITGFAKIGTGTAHQVDMGSGTITCSGNVNLTNITVTTGTGTLVMTGATKTLTWDGETLYNVTVSGNTTLSGASSVSNLFKCVTGDVTISFGTGVTHALNDLQLTGTSGHNVVMAPATAATMYSLNVTDTSLTSFSYVTTSYCNAAAGKPILATSNCTDGGNNYAMMFAADTLGNASYETQGTGGTYLHPYWCLTNGGATLSDDATSHAGTHAYKVVTGETGIYHYCDQYISVTAGRSYTWTFWYKDTEASSKYGVYDFTNSANIVALTGLSQATNYTQVTVNFTAPVGCAVVRLRLQDTAISGGTSYYDDHAFAEAVTATTITPTAGALTITGADPVRIAGTVIVPTPGEPEITGADPVLTHQDTITPTADELSIEGADVIAYMPIEITPTAADLEITGTTPDIDSTIEITTGAVNLTIEGATPILHSLAVIPAGDLSIDGAAGSTGLTITPAPATMALDAPRTSIIAGVYKFALLEFANWSQMSGPTYKMNDLLVGDHTTYEMDYGNWNEATLSVIFDMGSPHVVTRLRYSHRVRIDSTNSRIYVHCSDDGETWTLLRDARSYFDWRDDDSAAVGGLPTGTTRYIRLSLRCATSAIPSQSQAYISDFRVSVEDAIQIEPTAGDLIITGADVVPIPPVAGDPQPTILYLDGAYPVIEHHVAPAIYVYGAIEEADYSTIGMVPTTYVNDGLRNDLLTHVEDATGHGDALLTVVGKFQIPVTLGRVTTAYEFWGVSGNTAKIQASNNDSTWIDIWNPLTASNGQNYFDSEDAIVPVPETAYMYWRICLKGSNGGDPSRARVSDFRLDPRENTTITPTAGEMVIDGGPAGSTVRIYQYERFHIVHKIAAWLNPPSVTVKRGWTEYETRLLPPQVEAKVETWYRQMGDEDNIAVTWHEEANADMVTATATFEIWDSSGTRILAPQALTDMTPLGRMNHDIRTAYFVRCRAGGDITAAGTYRGIFTITYGATIRNAQVMMVVSAKPA